MFCSCSSYGIHTSDNGIILGGLILSGQKEAASLCCGQIDHIGLGRLSVDSINFDNGYVVSLKPKILTGKCTNVDDAEEVGFAGLNRDSEILGFIHQRSLRHRLRAGGVSLAHEWRDERLHLLMVPIGQGDDDFLIILVLVRVVRIMNNEGTAQAIRILALRVRVVPVCSRLSDLCRSESVNSIVQKFGTIWIVKMVTR